MIERKKLLKMKRLIKVFVCIGIILSDMANAFAYVVPDNLWKGIIAEASGEGREAMYRVACVVRNRLALGMNTGLCGLKRKDLDAFVKREGKSKEFEARDIVREVFQERGEDKTNGATHFESVDFREPKWAKKMVYLGQYKKHKFYKEIWR